MQRHPVTSSTIAEIGYDSQRQILEVLFRNGSLYQYFEVPQHTYEELMASGSVGQYFNANVKTAFRYARV